MHLLSAWLCCWWFGYISGTSDPITLTGECGPCDAQEVSSAILNCCLRYHTVFKSSNHVVTWVWRSHSRSGHLAVTDKITSAVGCRAFRVLRLLSFWLCARAGRAADRVRLLLRGVCLRGDDAVHGRPSLLQRVPGQVCPGGSVRLREGKSCLCMDWGLGGGGCSGLQFSRVCSVLHVGQTELNLINNGSMAS